MHSRIAVVAVAVAYLLVSHIFGPFPLGLSVWLAFAPLSGLWRIGFFALALLLEAAAAAVLDGSVAHVAGIAQFSLLIACPLLFVRECAGPIDRQPTVTRRGMRSLLYVLALNAFVVWLIGFGRSHQLEPGNRESLVFPLSLGLGVLVALTSVALCSGSGPLRYALVVFGIAGSFALERGLSSLPRVAPSAPLILAAQFALLCAALLAYRALGYRIWAGNTATAGENSGVSGPLPDSSQNNPPPATP